MTGDDFIPHLERFGDYEEACRRFRWRIPEGFNIPDAVCKRHPDSVTRIALIEMRPAAANTYTFNAIDFLADKFATVLVDSGVSPGDSIATILSQSAAVPVAHLGTLKSGAVVVPISPVLDPAVLECIVRESGASLLVVDIGVRGKLDGFIAGVATVRAIFVATDLVVGERLAEGDRNFWAEIYEASSDFDAVATTANTPAFNFYDPAPDLSRGGVTRCHGSLIGGLPAFEMCNGLALDRDTVFWTPNEWATTASLLGLLYPAWAYGLPVVAAELSRFDGERAIEVIGRCGVTTALMTPGQIAALARSHVDAKPQSTLKLRNVISTGGMLGEETRQRVRSRFGASVSQCYASRDVGLVTAHCHKWFASKPGSIGRPAPGHRVEVVDGNGNPIGPNTIGLLAINEADCRRFAAHSEEEGSTAPMSGEWRVTGDRGWKDEESYVWACE
ncbi:MAG TPA: AMP-binding protein [Blastocatellia bacterium]|nr:AMP-binding protein [Blastocatellia bacterium]